MSEPTKAERDELRRWWNKVDASPYDRKASVIFTGLAFKRMPAVLDLADRAENAEAERDRLAARVRELEVKELEAKWAWKQAVKEYEDGKIVAAEARDEAFAECERIARAGPFGPEAWIIADAIAAKRREGER